MQRTLRRNEEEGRYEMDRDTLELTMVLTHPNAYTKPRVKKKKTFRLDPKHEIQQQM
jgi:hypothetical protein